MIASRKSHSAWAKSRVIVNLRQSCLRFAAVLLALLVFVPSLDGGPKPLWQGTRYSQHDRNAAIERGLQFIYGIASNPEYFAHWGHDLLFCFYTISTTAKDEKLREMARTMGQERARQWRHDNPDPPTGTADALYAFVMGAQAADQLLGPDPAVRDRVRSTAEHFSVIDFTGFDARHEPPPADIPERCPTCKHQNPRGVTVCQKCQTPLTFRNPYDVWLDALVESYTGDAYGVRLGASYPEVVQWVSKMRPYPPPKNEQQLDTVAYPITHLIYTLNDYNKYRLSPAWLPQEFSYLKKNIAVAQRYEDAEILGEFMDTLRAFGEDGTAREMRKGIDFLLSHQNPDGSWGDMDDNDIYTRYHTTWTVIDGLREYAYRGERLRLPQLLPLIGGKPRGRSLHNKSQSFY